MERFESIVTNAIKDVVSDIYITGSHPMVSRKQGNIQFHQAIKWSYQEIDNLVRRFLNPKRLIS